MTKPAPPNVAIVRWLLRLVVLAQGLGVAGRYGLSQNEVESDVFGWLYFDCKLSESVAKQVDDLGLLACVCSGVLVVLCGFLQRDRTPAHNTAQPDNAVLESPTARSSRLTECTAAFIAASWMLALALTHQLRGGLYANLSLGEHAVRIAAPFALGLFAIRTVTSNDRAFSASVRGVLVIAAAATFLIHGFKALQCYGPFTDLVLLSNTRWLNASIEQSAVEWGLVVIGIVDVAVAIVLLGSRWRTIAFYMCFWGFLTAASRITAFGPGSWPELFIRAANGGVPLAIAVAWSIGTASEIEVQRSTPPNQQTDAANHPPASESVSLA